VSFQDKYCRLLKLRVRVKCIQLHLNAAKQFAMAGLLPVDRALVMPFSTHRLLRMAEAQQFILSRTGL